MNEDTRKLALAALVGILVGAAIGLLIGWWLWPVQWVNATPADLRTDLQADYMMMTIDSFRVNGDAKLASYRYSLLGADAPAALAAVCFLAVEQFPQRIESGQPHDVILPAELFCVAQLG